MYNDAYMCVFVCTYTHPVHVCVISLRDKSIYTFTCVDACLYVCMYLRLQENHTFF